MAAQQRIEAGDGKDAEAIKAMTSQISWAVLGLLLIQPGHGYQLIQRVECHYEGLLSIRSPGHIYTLLKGLARRGLIEEIPGPERAEFGADGTSAVPYRATEKGASSYKEHMIEMAVKERRQSRLFALQLAVFEHDPVVGLEILDHYESAYLREATRRRSTPTRSTNAAPSSGFADLLVSEESRLVAEGKLPWVEFARTLFRARLEAGS